MFKQQPQTLFDIIDRIEIKRFRNAKPTYPTEEEAKTEWSIS